MADCALKSRITDAMKDAMRAQDKPRLGTIRLMLADITRIEVDERASLDDARTLAVLDKMVKQRRESIQQYSAAGREDLASQERYEIGVIQEFLPAQLEESELDALIQAAIRETGAGSMQDMGKLMALLKPQLQGRADMGAVSQRIKALLAG